MRYIITEQQYNTIIEQSIPLWVRRRSGDDKFMEEFIDNAVMDQPTPCSNYIDEFEYATDIIRIAIDRYLDENEDNLINGEIDPTIVNYLTHICDEKYRKDLIEDYVFTCIENDN